MYRQRVSSNLDHRGCLRAPESTLRPFEYNLRKYISEHQRARPRASRLTGINEEVVRVHMHRRSNS